MFRRKMALRFGAAALALPLLVSCAGGGSTPTAQSKPSGQGGQRQVAVPVNVQAVGRGAVAATLTYSGNIQSRATVNVLPRATGRIERLLVYVGSNVRTGDPIAVLDRTQLE